MMGWLTGATQAEEVFQALAWSWGVPSIIPAGDLRGRTQRQNRAKNWLFRPRPSQADPGGALSQKVVPQVPIESPAEAQGVAAPSAVQLQVDPPPAAVVPQLQADGCLQLGEHGGQLPDLHPV